MEEAETPEYEGRENRVEGDIELTDGDLYRPDEDELSDDLRGTEG